jgi:hypothetical protein
MKEKAFRAALLLLSIYPGSLFAQGEICGDNPSPDDTCPLDTWVILLVIACLCFATYNLRKKRKKII